MKKIINQVESIVEEMCQGLVIANPSIEFIREYKILKKKNIDQNKVTLISGGGSGHEPAHGGFIGDGMLDAAVCGDVFASPSQVQVYQGIKATQSKQGTLLIVKNYSGDIMNFKNAIAMAEDEGIKVDYVKVDDDIAVEDSLYTVGHRGVAGTVLIHKLVGAASRKGLDLAEVKRVANKGIENVKTLGFALTSCTVPAKGTPTFELGEDEIEFGVGIHGEPGIRKEKVQPADELAQRMVEQVMKSLELDQNATEEVVVLVNGFGGSPLQELYLFNYAVNKELAKYKVKVVKSYVGNYMTSLDMAGASLTIMKVDEELKGYIIEDVQTPAFSFTGYDEPEISILEEVVDVDTSDAMIVPSAITMTDEKMTLANVEEIIATMSEIIIRNEVAFCDLDSHAGDGDFGSSIATGFRELRKKWGVVTNQETDSISTFLKRSAFIIMEHCGGASGPIWGAAFKGASTSTLNKESLTLVDFAQMMVDTYKSIQKIGEVSFGRGADIGDKTLIDALIPCALSLVESGKQGDSFKDAFTAGALAAVEGAAKTSDIVARMGRAGTVGERSIGYPDAGAYALGVIFTEISDKVK